MIQFRVAGSKNCVQMHEAFGAQVVCNLWAWEGCWKQPAIDAVDPDKLNPQGGSIAVGHPFAATGARIVTALASQMARRDARYGLASICGAGTTAGAMILERDLRRLYYNIVYLCGHCF